MPTEVFLDTAYAIALSSSNDQFHTRAVALAEQLEASGTRLVTTRAVLLEIGNALSVLIKSGGSPTVSRFSSCRTVV